MREKQNDCQKLISEVDDINAANNRQTTLAYDLLCKIEGIIHEYINIKMKMESSIAYKDVQDVSAEGLIGISINITVKQVINNIAASENNGHAQREIDDSWVFGFGGKVKIKSPDNVKENYAEMLRSAVEGLE